MVQEALRIIKQYGGKEIEAYQASDTLVTGALLFENESDFFKTLSAIMIIGDEMERELISVLLRGFKTNRTNEGIILY